MDTMVDSEKESSISVEMEIENLERELENLMEEIVKNKDLKRSYKGRKDEERYRNLDMQFMLLNREKAQLKSKIKYRKARPFSGRSFYTNREDHIKELEDKRTELNATIKNLRERITKAKKGGKTTKGLMKKLEDEIKMRKNTSSTITYHRKKIREENA